jgi:pimeloyl-ACP methyl ester carboxylesterase
MRAVFSVAPASSSVVAASTRPKDRRRNNNVVKKRHRRRGSFFSAVGVRASSSASSSMDEKAAKRTKLAEDNPNYHGDGSVSLLSTSRNLEERYHFFEGYSIRYVKGKNEYDRTKPNVILIHGFGGNADQWRNNASYFANEKKYNVYALDLLGYGYSEKPDPTAPGRKKNDIYNFHTWARQINEFIECEMEGEDKRAFLMCNSVGGVAGLQAALDKRENILGLCLINISMRGLHVTKQPVFAKPLIEAFQTFLRTSPIGPKFFANVARKETVSNILKEAYHDSSAVTDELVDVILKPGMTEGASKVFLDFISYSGGPLPEDLLPQVSQGENATPTLMLWGEKDPWEKMEDGRKLYEKYANAGFTVLKGAGHCPMDENPALVNPLMSEFIERYA